jgi:ubiquinone biosynthesis protein UbiJ
VADPASTLGSGLARQLLADEQWARERLRAHAGNTFSLTSGPLSTAYVIGEDGTLGPLSGAERPLDLELHVSPFDLPVLLGDPSRWARVVTEKGDGALAATLRELAQTLPWFVERACARTFGPIVGQRVADAGRQMLGMPEYVGTRLTDSLTSYARDEAGLLAHADSLRILAADNATLAERVAALEARIERLASPREPG